MASLRFFTFFTSFSPRLLPAPPLQQLLLPCHFVISYHFIVAIIADDLKIISLLGCKFLKISREVSNEDIGENCGRDTDNAIRPEAFS